MKRVLKWIGIVFGGLFVLGLIIQVVDPEGTKRRQEEREKAAAASPKAAKDKSDKDIDPVFKHGFQVGYVLAKGGTVKPSSDEVDAMARQAANALGEPGGLGFKMQWKNAFWAGWNKGD
jgi:hypothetical protein